MEELERTELKFYKELDLFNISTGKTPMPLSLALELQQMRTVMNHPFRVIVGFLTGMPTKGNDLGESLCKRAIERLRSQGGLVKDDEWFY